MRNSERQRDSEARQWSHQATHTQCAVHNPWHLQTASNAWQGAVSSLVGHNHTSNNVAIGIDYVGIQFVWRGSAVGKNSAASSHCNYPHSRHSRLHSSTEVEVLPAVVDPGPSASEHSVHASPLGALLENSPTGQALQLPSLPPKPATHTAQITKQAGTLSESAATATCAAAVTKVLLLLPGPGS